VTYQLDIAGLDSKLNTKGGPNELSKKSVNKNGKTVFSGFIAQEVEQAARETGYDFSGIDKPKNENDLYGLRYAEFVVPVVKAMQEQQVIIATLQKQVEAARAEIPTEVGKQQQVINDLKKQIDQLQKRVLDLEKSK
jgi:nucleoside-triphosphatase THEP1